MLTYGTFTLLFIAFDFLMAMRSFRKTTEIGKLVGFVCISAGLVNLCYFIGVLCQTEEGYSIANSLYFACIDVLLWVLYRATLKHTGLMKERWCWWLETIMSIWAVIDVLMVLSNPLHGVAVSYIPYTGTLTYPKFAYNLHFLYNFHLGITYCYVVLVISLLMVKARRVAVTYRNQYYIVVAGIAVVVLINCTYLFMPGDSVLSAIDWSLFGYSIAASIVYWSYLEYTGRGLLSRFKSFMFDNIDSGMVMFDYNGRRLLLNKAARELLPEEALNEDIEEKEFAEICGIPYDNKAGSVQCFVNRHTLRCDVKLMQDERGRLIGHMFIFTDIGSETDILTGFQKWEGFERFVRSNAAASVYPAVCAVCDLNSLQQFNNDNGRNAGDKLLRLLAEALKKELPKGTMFVRGREADLIAICLNADEKYITECFEAIKAKFERDFEYALTVADGEKVNAIEAIIICGRGIRVKKLLNKNAGRSDMLSSLIQALQECDSDTEEHVKRTRRMGDMLGRRLGLTDVQLSDLSLLCLLHDIGKIGIPLEILNKPGRLTTAEWNVLKTHVQKGYQIAQSSRDTQHIADMILHHHEKWDGTGYPDGLAGEEIPLLSRFIAVVDAFDAMVNDRVYRKALSTEEAYAELERCSGTQFDPTLVREFVAMQKENGFNNNVISDNPSDAGKDKSSGYTAPVKDVFAANYGRYLLDEDNRICEVYDGFEKLTGYTATEIKENVIRQIDLIPEADRQEYSSRTAEKLNKDGVACLEHRLKRKDGKVIEVLCYGKQYYDSAVRAGRSEIIVFEIGKTHAVDAMLDSARNHDLMGEKDTVTGLFTRISFENALKRKLNMPSNRLLVLFVQAGSYSEYALKNGDSAADSYLAKIAGIITESVRLNDFCSRISTNTFACIGMFDGQIADEVLIERSKQIASRINATLIEANYPYITLGAVLPTRDDDVDEVIEEGMSAISKMMSTTKSRTKHGFRVSG